MMISPEGGIYTKDIKRENYDREAAFYTSTVLGANLVLAKRKTTREKWAIYGQTQLCLTATPWTTAFQTPLSMGFSRQEY